MPTSSTPTTPSGRPAASVEELDAAPTKVGRYQRTFLAAGCVVASGASIIGCSAPPEHGNIRSIGRTKSAIRSHGRPGSTSLSVIGPAPGLRAGPPKDL